MLRGRAAGRVRAVASAGAAQAVALPASLTEHAYISREPGSGTREVIDHYLQKAGVSPDSLQVVMEAGSPEALKGLVATGLGFAIMSRAIVAKELRLGPARADPAAAAADPPFLGRLSEGAVPLEARQRFVVREGKARVPRSRVAGWQLRRERALDGLLPRGELHFDLLVARRGVVRRAGSRALPAGRIPAAPRLPSDSHLRSCVPDTCSRSLSPCGQVRPDAMPPQR